MPDGDLPRAYPCALDARSIRSASPRPARRDLLSIGRRQTLLAKLGCHDHRPRRRKLVVGSSAQAGSGKPNRADLEPGVARQQLARRLRAVVRQWRRRSGRAPPSPRSAARAGARLARCRWHLSARTVETYRSRLMAKLGLANGAGRLFPTACCRELPTPDGAAAGGMIAAVRCTAQNEA